MAHLLLAQRPVRKRLLVAAIGVLLASGFAATLWISYLVSKASIRELIAGRELPLTSDTIYSEIQKDLVRPIFVSSMMAGDTFLRDWVLRGERDVTEITRYLDEVKRRYGAFTSFFVSERSATYYHAGGILKKVRPDAPPDAWYYRVRRMNEPYEINVDPDEAHAGTVTIFINFRVADYDGRFLGAAGVGLTIDTVRRLMEDYQQRYRRTVYFADPQGRLVLHGPESRVERIRDMEGLGALAERVLAAPSGSYQYEAGGHSHLVHVRYVPELRWYLFVDQVADEAFADIRRTLLANLAICAGITALVLFLVNLLIARYQRASRASREETLRILSHDLRSPLASIVTLADEAPGACATRLAQAGRYARGALDLADGLVCLARAETADRRRFGPVDLATVAEEALDAVWLMAERKGIELRRDLPAEAPVRGDRTLLFEALVNLLDNAIKYSPQGSPVALAVACADGRCIARVEDRGPGIAAGRQTEIFLPYRRVGDATQPGLGLGLTIVQAVAERHGGRIAVASAPGHGATFTLELPRRAPPAAAA